MKLRTSLKRRLRSIAGFTLIEMLVIIIIIGILFAIAAPGWDAFLNNQRLSGARELAVQALKQAQTKAKTSRTAQIVRFQNAGGFPEFSSGVYLKSNAEDSSQANWQRLGESRLPAGTVEVKTSRTASTGLPQDSIVFDTDGAVAQYPLVSQSFDDTKGGYLRVTFFNPKYSNPTSSQRCVSVKSLLAAIQTGEGSACN